MGANDLALISEEIEQAQEELHRLQMEAVNVRLYCNVKKTSISLQPDRDSRNNIAKNGVTLKVVNKLKYLGAWIESSASDIALRKALAWSACHRLRKI